MHTYTYENVLGNISYTTTTKINLLNSHNYKNYTFDVVQQNVFFNDDGRRLDYIFGLYIITTNMDHVVVQIKLNKYVFECIEIMQEQKKN
jgi:hypothetical protein